MKYSLAQNRWHGERPVEIEVPDYWRVNLADMGGDHMPAMSYDQIREKIRHPTGSPTLKELAGTRKSAIILFENMSRGADTNTMAHIVLEELLAGGMKKENIVFMCACATHAPLDQDDFIAKLGADIVAEYEIYNHNCWQNFKYLGKTSRGFDVNVNAEVMDYDLKIGLGGMVPHPTAGFGGGSKIVLPGICSVDTITQNHKSVLGYLLEKKPPMVDMIGNMQNKDLREDVEEVARMVGLDFVVDTLYNSKTETVYVIAGDPLVSYYEDGMKHVKEVYDTPRFEPADVCIANANAKGNEAGVAMLMAEGCIKDGGDIVVINHSVPGNVNHYLVGMWGRTYGGNMPNRPPKTPDKVRKLILYTPWRNESIRKATGDRAVICTSWEDVMKELSDRGEGTRCTLFTDATIQFYADGDKLDYTPVNLCKK